MFRSTKNFLKDNYLYITGKLALALTFASMVFLLAGCNTVAGVGEDIQSLAGKKKPTYNCVPLVNTVIANPASQWHKSVH